jgi:hypothetical protein
MANASIATPTAVTPDRKERELLTTIYDIENAFVDALKKPISPLATKKDRTPSRFEKAVGNSPTR